MRVNLSARPSAASTRPRKSADAAQNDSRNDKPAETADVKPAKTLVKTMSVMQGGEARQLTEEEEREILEKTLEIIDFIAPNRSLKFELIDDADIVQVQVINTDDASVVRKIPADEVIERIKQIHELLSERLDVKA